MKSAIGKIAIFLVLYLVAAGGTSFYFEYTKEDEAPEEEAMIEPTQEELESGVKPGLPVALRPKAATSVEAIVQMSDSIRRSEQLLDEREKRIEENEERVSILFDDLELEREELKALSQSLDTKIESISGLTDQLKNLLDEMDLKKKELEALAKKTGTDEKAISEDMENRVNDVKSWFENLEAKQAADYLREFANNGKLEFAAALLQKMPDRQKSKILGAMSDPTLVDQLIDSLSTSTNR